MFSSYHSSCGSSSYSLEFVDRYSATQLFLNARYVFFVLTAVVDQKCNNSELHSVQCKMKAMTVSWKSLVLWNQGL